MTDSGQSRRRELRFPIAMPVTASIGKRGVEGETRDVSYSGMFVAVDKLPPLRSFIRVHLDFPNDRGAVDLSGMVVRVIEPSPDNETESGIGIQLYANGDDVLNTWNAFISTIPTEGDANVFEQTLTERNTSDTDGRFDAGIVLKNLSAEDLFRIYTLDIPRGLFFLSTENNLAIGDVILVDLIGKNRPEEKEAYPLKGRVIAQQREPGNFGVQLDFVDIRTKTLKSFWNFICDQTPARYPPMDFPAATDEPAETKT